MDQLQTVVLGALPDDPADEARVLAEVEQALFDQPPHEAKVGRYVLGRRLGAGAFGAVYEGHDPELDRRVAIKLVTGRHAADAANSRLVREAKLLAQLSHPNVVAVYDVGTTTLGGREDIYIVMELIEGVTLRKWFKRGEHPRARILDVFLAAARGLAAAHRKGIVHRDFKPDNVLVGDDGGVRVSDFGLARFATATRSDEPPEPTSPVRDTTVTADGAVIGTPAYMAPEQYDGEVGDARADQYAFCIALWEALTGARPFSGDASELAARKRDFVGLPPRPEVPGWLARALRRGLAPTPAGRFADMDALVAAIERGRSRRRRLAAIGLGLVAGAVAIAWGVSARAPACEDAGSLAQALWPAARRDALADTFARSAAGAGWAVVDRNVSAWVEGWASMHVRACALPSSDARGATALACLDRQRRRFAGFVQLLEQADAAVLEHAVRATSELPPLDPCAPEGEVAFPLDQGAFDPLEADVVAAEALLATGEHEAAIASATAVVDAARARAAAGPLARALLVRARAARWRGDYERSAADLADGLVQAERAADAEVAAEIAVEQVYVVGYWQDRIDAGRALIDQARARVSGANLEAALGPVLVHHEGMLDLAAGDHLSARARFEEALRRTGERFGPAHPQAVELETAIAVTYDRAGDNDEALARYEAAYAATVDLYGPDHPAVGGALKNLAWAQWQDGQAEVARENAARALAQLERSAGESTAMTTDALHLLAITLRGVPGRCDEALGYDERALALRRASLPGGHRRIGASLAQLARDQIECGKFADAVANARAARAVLEKTSGGAPLVGRTWLVEGWALRELGDAAAAIELHRLALAHEERHYDRDHPEAGFAAMQLGRDHEALGDREQARKWYADALDRYTRAGVADDRVAEARAGLDRLAEDER